MLDSNGHIPQNLLVAGYDKHSAYDLAWQSLHMAAAAACRGSTPSGGTGCCGNTVLVRNTASGRTCAQICALSNTPKCDAEVSIYGYMEKKERPKGMEKEWATFTTTIVPIGATEEVRRPTRMMPS